MARLFEYQSKELLSKTGIKIPPGKVCTTPIEVREFAEELGKPVVVKAQAWFTGRASVGGIKFADTPEEAEKLSNDILGKTFKNFTVTKVLVEEKINIAKEMFVSLIIDDLSRSPVIIFSSMGGTGVEEIAADNPDAVVKRPVDINSGLKSFEALNLIRNLDIKGKQLLQVSNVLCKVVGIAKKYEARSVEINPLVITDDGITMAADGRITIDDYAVFRHPELGIDFAREIDNPPTKLDKLAYGIEENDYRGTFYFIQLEHEFNKGESYVGFHGAGGGGSMMSMDAVQRKGYKLANFCDTSGNPPASKVYRAAKIIMAQKNIDGYFGSGSGVASQEQVNSARGLVKAFIENNLNIPAVVRLGGNLEEKAVEILETYTKGFVPAPVEGYMKDDTADHCAERIDALIKSYKPVEDLKPIEVGLKNIHHEFDTMTGKVQFDYKACAECKDRVCVDACDPSILKFEDEKPVLAIDAADAKKGKCTECLGCELECMMKGNKGCFVHLPIENLE
ncbi:MAG: succinyl-CoA synthetase subunit beta [bacterium]|nr:succinyl-CoA synthetase subunit beta [bacterium]